MDLYITLKRWQDEKHCKSITEYYFLLSPLDLYLSHNFASENLLI